MKCCSVHVYAISRVHCALGNVHIYFVDLIVFVLCASGSR